MTTVFHARSYGYSKLRRKKLHITNQGSNFLGGSFSNTDMKEPQSNLEEKVNPSILKDDFSSRTGPSIFTSITPVLLEWSNKISRVFPALKSRSHFLHWFTVSCRSAPSSEADFSSYHRSDA